MQQKTKKIYKTEIQTLQSIEINFQIKKENKFLNIEEQTKQYQNLKP